jgi:hypothetical protein
LEAAMVKDAAISIRVEPALKEHLERVASDAGLALAAYVESVLNTHSKPPQWLLADPEVVHTSKFGTAIKLNVAEGWPVCILSPAATEKLALELLDCANTANRLIKPEYDVYCSRFNNKRLAIVRKGVGLPQHLHPVQWRILPPPGGVAADIGREIEMKGVVTIERNFVYRAGEIIGSMPR